MLTKYEGIIKRYKVEHLQQKNYYGKDEPAPRETMDKIITDILGKDARNKGVKFEALYKSSIIYGAQKLHGLQLSVQKLNYRNIFRRIMIKNATIDSDDLITKFNELVELAKGISIAREQRDSTEEQSNKLYRQFVSKVKLEIGGNIYVYSNTPDTLKMSGYINGKQLSQIEQLIGEQNLEIKLVVPANKAEAIYNILKG